MKTTKLPVAELVEDFGVYPRMDVNDQHVAHIAEAIESGSVMPPIVADAKTKRIVDGFHRSRAARRVYGEEAVVDVELREYATEAELLVDAIRFNSCHGRTMASADRAHAIILADRLKAPSEALAKALNITVERVETIRKTLTVRVEDSRKRVPLKMVIRHMSGQELSKEQAEIVPKLGGNSARFYVEQLVMLIERGLLDGTNEALFERLRFLGKLIGNL